MSGDLKNAEREYQKKVQNNSKLTCADMAEHNEFIERFRFENPIMPRDIARVPLKGMPNPTGKVYKGDEKIELDKNKECGGTILPDNTSDRREYRPHDPARVTLKGMPNPTGKVYKGDER